MKARVLVAIAAVVAVIVAAYLLARGNGGVEGHGSGAGISSAASGQASPGSGTGTARATGAGSGTDPRADDPRAARDGAADRTAMLDAIATARNHRLAASSGPAPSAPELPAGTTLDIQDKTGDTSAWEKRTLGALNTLLGQCYDLGRAEDPKLEGTLLLRFTLVGEPGVGGLLERVDIVPDGTTITQATTLDCMTQQLYALELDPPPEGTRVEREVSLRFP